MKEKLIIYGAGGLGREVLSLVKALSDWEPAGFIDDTVRKGTIIAGVPVLGGCEILRGMDRPCLTLAIGDPIHKTRVAAMVKEKEIIFPVLVHPSAILQNNESIYLAAGSIVAAGSVLTTDIQIGEHSLINLNVTIGHDCKIGNFCSIMPGVNIAGGVTIGSSVLIGSGASILNRIQIASGSRVGMGAVVIKDVPENETVAGVPARPIRK